ncbi:potassium transporter TrkA [Bdellovibrio bacteriovorus]|uniref:Potassium transporter TrkA n=1 Tax=Bdellovibrio bacteriovorus TaxID=959 RepID=A0A150WJ11_BDEBC|nr:SLC13 family permease [Bdellovibrio bacteriovorus]KYG63739.1 potassium transporter TrkA [Bdellovibrio bacteriovorus]
MDLHQIYFLIILVAALYFFISEKLSVDMTAMLIILSLAITGVLDAKEAFSGFASEPALIVCAVFVLSAGLAATGVTDTIGNAVAKFSGKNQLTANLVIMTTVAGLSAFTHHLMVTAMMLPIAMRISRENEIPSSRLLIPMATAASLGTTLTLIGAPAFLLANGILKRAGEPALRLFSVTPLGAVLVLGGFVLILLTLWVLPKTSGRDKADERFRINEIFTELLVPEESRWIGVSLEEFKKETAKRFEIVGMKRYNQRLSILQADLVLQHNDLLLVKTTPDELLSLDERMGLALRSVKKYGEQLEKNKPVDGKPRDVKEPLIVQGLVAPQSGLIGKTVGEIDFLHSLGVLVVGIWRKEGWIYHELSQVRLKEGDMVILWGDEETFDTINADSHFLLLFPMNLRPKKRFKAKLASAIMLTSVVLAATEVLAPHISFLLGAFVMVATKCVSLPRAYESIEVKIFVMIAGVIPLGLAMEKTGLAKLFAENLAGVIHHWPPWAILLCFFSAAALLTQILSDAATTVLIAPIAVAFAKDMHMSPTAMVVCVTVGAVASFLTPIGHHGNLLVLGPGNYRFVDFLKIGLPLTIFIAGATVYVAGLLWG